MITVDVLIATDNKFQRVRTEMEKNPSSHSLFLFAEKKLVGFRISELLSVDKWNQEVS